MLADRATYRKRETDNTHNYIYHISPLSYSDVTEIIPCMIVPSPLPLSMLSNFTHRLSDV